MKSYLLIIRLALGGIFENKVRAFLTMLGIIIGVGSVVAIMSIGAGAQSMITGSIQKVGTNLIGILPGSGDDNGPPASAFGMVITTLNYDDAKALEKIPNVAGMVAFANGSGDVVYGNESQYLTFSGVTAGYTIVHDHQVERGRFFTEQEERSGARIAVLGSTVKEDFFPFTDPIGKKIRVKDQSFTIIGVLEPKGSSMVNNPDTQIFVPLSSAQKILLGIHHVNFIRLKIDSEENIDLVIERVKNTLRYRHGIRPDEDSDFIVNSLSKALDMFKSVTDGIRLFLAAIAAVSLIVGGIGITNIMLMSVKERTREIGLKKAIGATPTQIKNQFILEALMMTGIGGLLGIIGGIIFSWIVALIMHYLDYSWDFIITPVAIIISFSVSVLIGVLFGIYPARQAANLNPIEALRYE